VRTPSGSLDVVATTTAPPSVRAPSTCMPLHRLATRFDETPGLAPEVAPFGLGDLLPAHRELVELGDQEGAEKVRVFLANRAVRKLGEEDLAVVHDRSV